MDALEIVTILAHTRVNGPRSSQLCGHAAALLILLLPTEVVKERAHLHQLGGCYICHRKCQHFYHDV